MIAGSPKITAMPSKTLTKLNVLVNSSEMRALERILQQERGRERNRSLSGLMRTLLCEAMEARGETISAEDEAA